MTGPVFWSEDDQSLKELGLTNPQRSAFGELMVSEKSFSTGWNFFQDLDPDNVSVIVTGSGVVNQADSIAVISSGITTASTSSVKTKEIVKYLNGTGIEVLFTAIYQTGIIGTVAEVGVGDDNNGFFFQELAGVFGICIRRNGADAFTSQANWNRDKMDGSGISGQTIDITKGNVYKIEYQWLGFGAINFYIEDSVSGLFQLVHREEYANNNTETSISVPNLPMRAFVDNTTSIEDVVIKTSSSGAYNQGKPNTVRPGNIPIQVTDDTILNSVAAVNIGKDPEGMYQAGLLSGVDEGNSSLVLLGNGGTFTGDWRNVEGYSAVSISTKADQLSAVNGIFAQFADDELGTNLRTARVETYSADSINKLAYYTWHGTLGRFMRILWTNGATPQTDFFLTTFLHIQSTELPQSPVTSSLGGGTPSITTRSVIAGRKDDGSNDYDNVSIHQEQGFNSLATAPGHRISQMFGRSHFEYENGFTPLSANTLLFTVPVGFVLHITAIAISAENQSGVSTGRILIADAIAAGVGNVKGSLFIEEAGQNVGKADNFATTFEEPALVQTGLYFNVSGGTIEANVHIIGYLEPV